MRCGEPGTQNSCALGHKAGGRGAPRLAVNGARTMTGQEVPRDALPAPQVARPASLGIWEVLPSRWVPYIAADLGCEQKRLGAGVQGGWASAA